LEAYLATMSNGSMQCAVLGARIGLRMIRERSFPERRWPKVIFNFFKMTRTHGGKRAGAGKPKGSISPPEVLGTDRGKREIEELTREAAAKTAIQYVAQAFETLSVVMRTGQSEQAKVAAAKEIFGKAREPPQRPSRTSPPTT
jgi:hypothetical protein